MGFTNRRFRRLAQREDRGYDGFIAIEPHVATVFHASTPADIDWNQCYQSYVAYGREFEALMKKLKTES